MVLVLGLVDDRRGVDPKVRLVVEILAAVVLILNVAGNPGVVFLLLGVHGAAAINSVNLFDGLDGLVGSGPVGDGGGFGGPRPGEGSRLRDTARLAVAPAGFLVLNWNPALVLFWVMPGPTSSASTSPI